VDVNQNITHTEMNRGTTVFRELSRIMSSEYNRGTVEINYTVMKVNDYSVSL
jgi:hypothetical protein